MAKGEKKSKKKGGEDEAPRAHRSGGVRPVRLGLLVAAVQKLAK